VALAALVATPTAARQLTAADTAAIYGLVYNTVNASWSGSANIAVPVWLPDSNVYGTQVGEGTLDELENWIPTIKRASSVLAVVDCEPGQLHMYPRGCPIRDSGRIVSFSIQEFNESDETIVVGVTIAVMTKGNRSYAYGGACRVQRQEDGSWKVVEVLDLRIT
jgi:hypothetical protein